MRVMVMSWEYPPHITGGMGEHVKQIVPALLALDPGLAVDVVTPTFFGETAVDKSPQLTIHRVAVERPRRNEFFDDVQRANRVLAAAADDIYRESGDVDFIHVHDWLTGPASLVLNQTFGVPILTTVHATERGRYRGSLHSEMSRAIDSVECELAQRSGQIIACSKVMAHEVCNYFGIGCHKLSVIPNGVDATRFRPLRESDHTEFRLQYAEPDECIIFNVGRLVYEKGADLVIEAAPAILTRFPKTKFVIGGRGPLLPGLEQRSAELGLEDRVILAGYLSDLDRDQLYVIADCCVFPSRYEPFGIVALESMAAGTPVVASGVGGLGTVVTHEVTGLTIFSENVDSLAWGIIQTLGDPIAAERRANRALDAVETCLAWPVIAGMTLELYHDFSKAGEQLERAADL
ncbi:MAG: glycosyltransferase family 4 protein [Chloroflexota bacterium]|nr:glycosyltransferase family 4 protein [Chloroflexota bacterium]